MNLIKMVREADGIYEIKNIAVQPDCQRKGYGNALIEFLFSSHYADCRVMLGWNRQQPQYLEFLSEVRFYRVTSNKKFLY